MDREERESVLSYAESLERAGRVMQESTRSAVELIKRATHLLEQKGESSEARVLEEEAERLSSLLYQDPVETMAARPTPSPRLHKEKPRLEVPTRWGNYWTFSMFNPLELVTSDERAWESPVVSLGGENGYRAGIRVYMSGKGSLKGQAVSVCFFLSPGPYDDWLEWPFPGKSVSVAMFRTNGKPPHVVKIPIPSFEKRGVREVSCSSLLSIDKFIEDKDFVRNKSEAHGKNDVLLLGFAVEGEDNFSCAPNSFLEHRIQQLEKSMKRVEMITGNGIEASRRVARSQYRYMPADNCCC